MKDRQRPIKFLILSLLVVATAAIVLVWSGRLSQNVSHHRRALAEHDRLFSAVLDLHAAMERVETAAARGRSVPLGDRLWSDIDQLSRQLTEARTASLDRLHGDHLRSIAARAGELTTLGRRLGEATAGQTSLGAAQASELDRVLTALEISIITASSSLRDEQQRLSSIIASDLRALQRTTMIGLFVSIMLAAALVVGWYVNSVRQNQAMSRIRETKQRFDLLAENMPGVIYLCRNDERYTMLYLNDAVEELTGYPAQEFLDDRISFVELYHPEDEPYIGTIVDKAIEQRRPFQLRYRIRHRSGEWRWVEEVGSGVFRNDELAFLEGVLLDVTARVQAEQQLERQQRFLRQVIDTNPNFVFAKDRQGRFTLVNRALAEAYGTTVEQLTGRTDADFNPQTREVEHFRKDDIRVIDTGRELVIPEESVSDAQGRTRWVQTVKRPIRNEEGVIDQVLGVATDITSLKRAELLMTGRSRVLERLTTDASVEEVMQSLAEAAEMVEPNLKGAVYLVDESTSRLQLIAAPSIDERTRDAISRELAADPGAPEQCAATVMSGQPVIITDLESVADRPCVHLLQRAGLRSAWIEPIQAPNGEQFGIFSLYSTEAREPEQAHRETLESCAKIAAIAIQRRKAEDDLRESQSRLRAADRLASIGTLTAGLGHDMNNVLFPLRCRLDVVRWETLDAGTRELVTATRDTVAYLQQLCDGLRLLSSDPDSNVDAGESATRLGQWWTSVMPLIRDALHSRAELEHDIPEDLPPVRVQEHLLTQAVLNLVINAGEASIDDTPIRVWARRDPDDQDNSVQIGVTDFGSGMSEEVRQRAVDPFYTTKARTLSTGLGLSLVHGTVKHVGGSMHIESEPGRGTTVILTLPAAHEAPDADADQPRQAVVSLSDAHLAAWVIGVLRTSGYDVRRSHNSEPPAGDLWVTEPGQRNLDRARWFVKQSPDSDVIVLGDASEHWTNVGAVIVRSLDDLAAIKAAVNQVRCERGVEIS